MEQNFDALNGMYDQIEMNELSYYNKLFKEGGNSMDNNTRATGADFYSIFAGTGITRTYPAEFDITVEDYGDGDDDDDFDTRCSIIDDAEALEVWATNEIVKIVRAGGKYVESDVSCILDTYHEGMKKLHL